MTLEEKWQSKLENLMNFIRKNHRNPSKHNVAERNEYYNWIKYNRKLLNAGQMKTERVERFRQLLALIAENRHVNQYQ